MFANGVITDDKWWQKYFYNFSRLSRGSFSFTVSHNLSNSIKRNFRMRRKEKPTKRKEMKALGA